VFLGIDKATSALGPKDKAWKHVSFYTAALNDSIEAMVESAAFGRKFTPHLKIKLDGNVSRCASVLKALDEWSVKQEQSFASTDVHAARTKTLWSLDANSSWTPEIAMQMATEVLPAYAHRILMLEQPFPFDIVMKDVLGCSLSKDESMQKQQQQQQQQQQSCDAWLQVKSVYNKLGIDIYADESMRTYKDIESLKSLVNGVNIKMEKAGGYRPALLAITHARAAGLKVWLGCMVGSNLNCTATAQLVALADASDVDGGLLVDDASQLFQGGFKYGPVDSVHAGTIIIPDSISMGVQLKSTSNL
jgi:L-alanine-DL-glutamate epimerase-like enolase superfamily enzyme